MVQLILSSTRNKGFSPNPQRFYFFRAYPDGHFGLVPVTFFDNFPFTHVIVVFAGGATITDGCDGWVNFTVITGLENWKL